MYSYSTIYAIKLLLLLLFLLIIYGTNGLVEGRGILFDNFKSNLNKNQFELHLDKLDAFFHRTVLMALLKAKARNKLRKMPKTERIIFAECLTTNKSNKKNNVSPVKMAKCLVKLFDASEAQTLAKNMNENHSGMSFFEWVAKWIFDLAKALKKENGQKEMQQKHSNYGSNNRNKKLKQIANSKKYYFTNVMNTWHENEFEAKRRRKRGENLMAEEKLKNIEMLRKLQNYIEKSDWANEYLQELSKKNINIVGQQIMKSSAKRINVEFRRHHQSAAFDLANQIQSILFKGSKSISLLSPRLFSLFPSKNAQNGEKLLSPDLLSFHQNGLFSLPKTFKEMSIGEMETLKWMDLLLEMTGSGKELAKLIQNLSGEMENLEQKILPAIKKLKKMDRELEEMKSKLNRRQKRELKMKGYTSVDEGKNEIMLEGKIRELAKLPENLEEGSKISIQNDGGSVVIDGQSGNGGNVSELEAAKEPPDEEHGSFPRTVPLTSSAFVHRVDGAIIEGVYLSPHAFATEIISPEFFTIYVLSPAAFVAVVLSPMAVISRILSPWAFRAEILSPEAFISYILNPDVFMAEVLSPKAFEPRVLSPKSMFIQILTPIAASPRIGSPESMGLLVLSPNFLSPRINSSESMMIEVLSPHILGGEHEHHEDDVEEAGGAIHIIGSRPAGRHGHGQHQHGEEHNGHGEGREQHNEHHGNEQQIRGNNEEGGGHQNEGGHENHGEESNQAHQENNINK